MRKEIVPRKQSIFPEHIGNLTLNELARQRDITMTKKDNMLVIKRVTDKEILNVKYHAYEDGAIISQSHIDVPRKKMDLHHTAKQLYKENKTQTEIADILNVSQPYVSKMLKMKD